MLLQGTRTMRSLQGAEMEARWRMAGEAEESEGGARRRRSGGQKELKLKWLRRNIDVSTCVMDESCAYRQSGFTHTHPVGVAVRGCWCWRRALLLLLWLLVMSLQ